MYHKNEGMIKMGEQNELIRKLRKERHLSQAFLAEGITTREAVSKFETRGTEISAQTLFAFLNKMNIEPEEYVFLLQSKNIFKQKINQVGKLLMQSGTHEQQSYIKELNQYYFETNDPFYKLISCQYQLLFNSEKLKDSEKFKSCEKVIKDYLNQVENWGRFELTLYSNVLFIFDSDLILATHKNVISKMKIYNSNAYYKYSITTFFHNVEMLFCVRKDFSSFQKILPYYKNQTKEADYCYERINYLIFEKIAQKGSSFKISEISNELSILNYLGYKQIATDITSFVEQTFGA